MKKLFASMVVIMLAMIFVSGTVWAFDSREHVSVAPNGKGDVLIFPQYIALSGWDTKLTVINTSASLSVVAKVVIRGGRFSQELLDFFIYLSPTDVWTGRLEYGPDGPRMWSTDDSCFGGTRSAITGWASPSNPMNVTLYDVGCGEILEWGYATVIEAWNCGKDWTGTNPDHLGTPPVLKPAIKSAYEQEGAPRPCIFPDADIQCTANVLAGSWEFVLMPGLLATGNATALRNHSINQRIELAVETYLGGTDSRNTLCEVEAALSKDHIALPYYAYNSPYYAFYFFTFPTKYTELTDCLITDVRSPYFWENYIPNTAFCVEYAQKYWDLEENTPTGSSQFSPVPEEERKRFCAELNMIFPDFVYDEGWARYTFSDSTTCGPRIAPDSDLIAFTGAPVIPYSLVIKGGIGLLRGAYDDGDVLYGGILYPDYQVEYAGPGKYPCLLKD